MLGASGESLTFRGAPLTALVNRGLDVPALERGAIEFLSRDQTRVEYLRDDLPESPRAGELFEDSDGAFHRIQTVRQTDLTFVCLCEQSPGGESEASS